MPLPLGYSGLCRRSNIDGQTKTASRGMREAEGFTIAGKSAFLAKAISFL